MYAHDLAHKYSFLDGMGWAKITNPPDELDTLNTLYRNLLGFSASASANADQEAMNAQRTLASQFEYPFMLSAFADFLFCVRDVGNNANSNQTYRYIPPHEYELDVPAVERIRDVFETIVFGHVVFPIPEERYSEVTKFIERYLLLSRYFAYEGSPDSEEKKIMLDFCRAASAAFQDSMTLWNHAFKALNLGSRDPFDRTILMDPDKPLDLGVLYDLGKLIGADKLVYARVVKKIPMHDLILSGDKRTKTKEMR